MDFVLTEAVSEFRADQANAKSLDSDLDVEALLAQVIPLPNNPLDILANDNFDAFSRLLQALPLLEGPGHSRRVNMAYHAVIDCLGKEANFICRSTNGGTDYELADTQDHQDTLDRLAFLLFVTVTILTNSIQKGSESAAKSRKRKNADTSEKAASTYKQEFKRNVDLLCRLMDNVNNLLKCNLISIFQTQTELSNFIVHGIISTINQALKSSGLLKEELPKIILIDSICLCAKNQQETDQILNLIITSTKLYDHLPEVMADVLVRLVRSYENESILRATLEDIASTEITSDNSSILNKHISQFLIKLADGVPDILINYDLVKFIGVSPTIRSAVIQCFQKILSFAVKDEDYYNKHIEKIDSIFEIVHSRLFDSYFSVRQKCLQLIEHLLTSSNAKVDFKLYKLKWVTVASEFLDDRTSFVRKAAFSILAAIIERHPFQKVSDTLEFIKFWTYYKQFNASLKELNVKLYNTVRQQEIDHYEQAEQDDLDPFIVLKAEESKSTEDFEFDRNNLIDADENLSEEVSSLLQKRSMARDACAFILQIHKSVESATLLLNSKSKSDIIESMDYFTTLDAYNIQPAKNGIKQMLHLVWRNSSNEEDLKVLMKLINCYTVMFLNAPPFATPRERGICIATQLVELTYNCNIADLISLGKLLCEIYSLRDPKDPKLINYKQNLIDMEVISALWSMFCQGNFQKERDSAMIILSMLSDAEPGIIIDRIDDLIVNGLKTQNCIEKSNIYACVALRKAMSQNPNTEDMDYSLVISCLKLILVNHTDDGHWYHLAEEALSTLYEIDPKVNETVNDIIKDQAQKLFAAGNNDKYYVNTSLCQFVFLLGHVALKTIIYLEKIETDFKRRKNAIANSKNEQDLELEMIGGSNEDEFGEVLQNVREKELLFGEHSILQKFFPLVFEILSSPQKYSSQMLQRQATLTFGKFMCVSPYFCEKYLSKFIDITRRSSDTIVRANGILSLGDIAVSFNNIMDERRDDLYVPLIDKDISVQRTCLMTVTFLILAGQIKVKGQLAQLSKLLVHDDPTIKEMIKLFFLELATKDNAIYNGFIDMVGGLNKDPNISPENFKIIIRYVSGFLKLDKHRFILIKKFNDRLLNEKDENCWNNLAFCIKELIRRDELRANMNNSDEADANVQIVGESVTEKKAKKQELYQEILKYIDEGFKQSQLETTNDLLSKADAAVEDARKAKTKAEQSANKSNAYQEEEDEEKEREGQEEEEAPKKTKKLPKRTLKKKQVKHEEDSELSDVGQEEDSDEDSDGTSHEDEVSDADMEADDDDDDDDAKQEEEEQEEEDENSIQVDSNSDSDDEMLDVDA